MKLTKEMLAEMAQTDIRTVDISELTDLRDIKIGDYVVKVRFQESGATIDDKMAEYLRRMSEIYI